jgi:hypothetical protein
MRLFIGPAILAFSFGLNPEQEPSHHSSQQEAEARTVAHRPGESVRVRVPLSQAANHRVTIVSFPEPVARAIVPWGEEDISIETDGREVVLKLLKPVEGDLAFRGAKSGTLFRLRVAPAKGDGDSDGLVRIVLPDEKPAARAIPAPAKSGAIELLRSMRLAMSRRTRPCPPHRRPVPFTRPPM